MGISHKRFLGWEPTTIYTYDDAGRLIESVPEPEWDESQRDAMIALQRYRETEQCPKCGGPKWVCQSAEAESAYEAGDPVRCHITTAILRAQKDYSEGPHSPHEQALLWPIRIRDAKPPQ